MKKGRRWIALLVVMLLIMLPASQVLAATSDSVTVTATPEYIAISNSPVSYDFGVVSASSTPSTSNGYFTITNSSTVTIDVNIKCNGWSGTSSWTYGTPAADTGDLDASSANGGTGGSGGAGLFDIAVLNGSDTLIMDAVGTSTNPTWELRLNAPTSFTHGYQQTTTVTLTAVAN